MAGRIHVLWPDEIWDLWGEREAKKEGRWSIESARVAQFTTHQAAVSYLNSCELYPPEEEPIGMDWSMLMAQITGRACPPRKPFAKDSLLADWERAFVAKAQVLPVDPVYTFKENIDE